MDSANRLLSEASPGGAGSATGEALKNGVYGTTDWYVSRMSLLARERFKQFRDNVRVEFPKWNEGFTLLLLSEAVLVPHQHMPGVKALEIPFNAILELNPEVLGNRHVSLREALMGLPLVSFGVTGRQDDRIRTKLKAQSEGTYEEPTVVGGRQTRGSAKT